MKPERRRNWMVNRDLQESLSRRLLVYWCGTWLAIFAVPACARLIGSELSFPQLATELVSDMWFPMVMSLLVMPIVFWDSVRFSHRIAGPVKRVSNDLGRLADGQKIHPIRLREGDFCHDLAENMNRVIDRIEDHEAAAKELDAAAV